MIPGKKLSQNVIQTIFCLTVSVTSFDSPNQQGLSHTINVMASLWKSHFLRLKTQLPSNMNGLPTSPARITSYFRVPTPTPKPAWFSKRMLTTNIATCQRLLWVTWLITCLTTPVSTLTQSSCFLVNSKSAKIPKHDCSLFLS